MLGTAHGASSKADPSTSALSHELYAGYVLYMVMSPDQIAGRSHNTKTENISFERVEKFKYLGTTLTHHNSIQEERAD